MSNSTNYPQQSFIDVSKESHFPIQNLPYGIFSTSANKNKRVGVAIGEYILDLSIIEKNGLLQECYPKEQHFFAASSLNKFMATNRALWRKTRNKIAFLLDKDTNILRDNNRIRDQSLVKMKDATMHLPAQIGDYTDFYSSKQHATNVGTMFRGKENALQPNWLHLPVGYHGRASSVVVSGKDFYRPKGQIKIPDENDPIFGSSKLVDFELEMGFFIGSGNELGNPIPIEKANDHIFGLVLVNDWSARDIQAWEYVPLGPFNAKNFITSISPWIVTLEALEPFKVNSPTQDPKPLPYLYLSKQKTYDIKLEVFLQTKNMIKPEKLVDSNFKYLYWTMEQQLTHHTITGCNLQPGDLLGSGTISGNSDTELGSMLELTWRGSKPLKLLSGEERKFLEDYDTVIMKGYCQGKDYNVGFGEVRGKVLPSLN